MTRPKSRPTTGRSPLSPTPRSEVRDRAELRSADDEKMAAHRMARNSADFWSPLALILLGRSETSLFCSPSEGRPSMGDYHSIIARAVSHLPSTADEARHAIYEQARTALHERLSNDPQISDTELVNEHYRLEVAIYEVEDDLLLSAMRRFVTEETAFSPPSLIISKIKEFVRSSGAKFVRLGVF